MEEFNLFEDLLPMSSLTGLSESVEEVDDFGYLGNVFPGDSQIRKMAPKLADPCDNILDLLSIENAEGRFYSVIYNFFFSVPYASKLKSLNQFIGTFL